MEHCPENAITIENGLIKVRTDLCSGMGCLKCVLSCPNKVFKYGKLLSSEEIKAAQVETGNNT
jgi:Fe-S-cluster-containing hydrogenase component 2